MKMKKALLFFAFLFGISFIIISPSASAKTETTDVQSLIDYGYEDYLLKEIIEFEKNNPNLSQKEVDAYFLELVKKYHRDNKDLQIEPKELIDTSSTITPFYLSNDTNYIYEVIGGQCRLNSLEQALFNANPTNGFKACLAGKEAQDYTIYKFGKNGHNDKTDAFRHAAWNINIIGFTDDIYFAKEWTDAHEDGALSQPYEEYHMDLNNNSVGRMAAKSAGVSTSSSITTVRNVIDTAYKSGNLQYINPSTKQLVYFTGYNSDYIR